MFKTFIDAAIAFFKTPQAAPVVAQAPYKQETPVVANLAIEPVAVIAAVIVQPVTPKKTPRKKTATVSNALRKDGEPVKKPVTRKKAPK